MKRFILTGAPGAGKTSILQALAAGGHAVVPEAATDVMTARLAQEEKASLARLAVLRAATNELKQTLNGLRGTVPRK